MHETQKAREFAEIIKRNIANAPLLCQAVGVAGAVVFTRSIADAVVASVVAIIVMTAATAASSLLRRVCGAELGGFIVFFATATAAVTVCMLCVMRFLPIEWERIGACCPLFTAGSLAAHVARAEHDDIAKNVVSSFACAVGYGLCIIAVAIVRTAAGGMAFFATPGGALVTAGILASLYRAARGAYRAFALSRSVAAHSENVIVSGVDVDRVEILTEDLTENQTGKTGNYSADVANDLTESSQYVSGDKDGDGECD